MTDVCFSKSDIVISRPRIEIFRRNLVLLIETDILKSLTAPSPKPEVKLRHSSRHLENLYNIISTPRIWMKFDKLVQNDIPITVIWSKL